MLGSGAAKAIALSTYSNVGFKSKSACNPDVLAIVNEPSVIVFCLVANTVSVLSLYMSLLE